MSLEIYKKGQGYYTRMCSAIAGGILAAMGSYALYQKLEVIQTQGSNLRSWLRVGIPLVLFMLLALLLFKLMNMPKLADFMISTEGEMKKVSWSSKKELIGSTKVVIGTVITMAIFLATVDFFFVWLFKLLGILG